MLSFNARSTRSPRTRVHRRLLRTTAALLLTFAGSSFAPASLAQAPADPAASEEGKAGGGASLLQTQYFKLDNGLRVYLVEDHSGPSVFVSMAYDVGSIDETPGRTGFAHLFEHLMFGGSKLVAPGGILANAFGAGGSANATTTNDNTVYYQHLPSNYLEMGLWQEADRLRSPKITEASLEGEKAAVASERAMNLENLPFAHVEEFEVVPEVYFGTPYAHSVIGAVADVQGATLEPVKEFLERYYSPKNGVLVVVGDTTLEELKTLVTKHFADIPGGSGRASAASGNQRRGSKVEKVVVDRVSHVPALLVAWPTVADDHADRPALELLALMLGGDENSRLHRSLVAGKHLAIDVAAEQRSFDRAGGLHLKIVAQPGSDMAKIKSIVAAELATLKKKKLRSNELERAIKTLELARLRSLETSEARAQAVIQGVLWHNDSGFANKDIERLRAVTIADLKRVAETYLTADWILVEVQPAG